MIGRGYMPGAAGLLGSVSMRIGIDTHFITSEPATGNQTYTAELVRALVAADERNEYVLYAENGHSFYRQLAENSRVRTRQVLSGNGLIRNVVSLPHAHASDALDILHVQYILPLFVQVLVVLTIPDLYYFYAPTATRYQRMIMRLSVWSARHAQHVITVSEYSKQDILRRAGIAPEHVTVTPEGVDRRFSPLIDSEALAELRRRLGIRGPYILFVGRTDDPRKNILTLVKAYASLIARGEIVDQLVIAGRWGPGTTAITALIRKLGMEHRVLLPGAIDDSDLPTLYAGATVFAYVSSFEGFGLPVLEAMACGTPVITSNATSLPEVAGNAAILITPGQVDALASAIHQLLGDSAMRQDLQLRGLARAREFTWERTARQVLRVYDLVRQARQRG